MNDTQQRFIKIGVEGKDLPADAADWQAVKDTVSGLMWTVKERKAKSHAAAEAVVKEMKDAGFDDWRMPTIEELFLLADRSRTNPAIDTALFPGCKSDWYWSSTPYAASPAGYAWIVYFGYGYAYWLHRDNEGFVRAVRPSQ